MVMAKKKANNKIRLSAGDKVFDIVNHIALIIIMIIIIYPLYYTIIASLSDIDELALGNVYFWPRGFSLKAYQNVMMNSDIWLGYRNSLFYMVFGSAYNLLLMLPLSYALSKKQMFGRSAVTWFFLITMYFSGGMIPGYLLRNSLGLVNNPLVLIVGGVSVYYTVVTRIFFQTNIPGELYESAKIDGADEFCCFFRIALPLSGAIIAVMALFFATSEWNSYMQALIYFSQKRLYPLQLILRNILVLQTEMMMDAEYFALLSSEEQEWLVLQARMAYTMRYAVVFIASAPLLIAYPFVQKYFVKGVMIGSLKG